MADAGTFAWSCAIGGLLLGGLAAPVPGFPGCAVALLGLVAFAALSDFAIVTPPALLVATALTVAGVVLQLAAPATASRVLGGSAGAATGAAVGALVGVVVPIPGASLALAVLGAATLGLLGSTRELGGWLRGVLGTSSGCLVGLAADALAVLGVGAVLAISDFLHALARAPAG